MLKFSEHLTKGEIFVFFVLLKKVKLKTITMKKKVTLLCAVAAMGIAAAAGVSLQNRAQLSDVALANIEAIAAGEGGDEGLPILCYPSVEPGNPGSLVVFCGTCSTIPGYKPSCFEPGCEGSCQKL